MMRVFRACPAPDVGSSTACRGSKFHSLLKARIPWSQGKKQGIFSIQPFFAKIRFENICEFSCLRVNSLRRQSREFFCQGREFFAWAGNGREFGARPIRSPRRIRSRQKYFLVVDKRILNAGCGPDEHAWLLPTGRALDARAEPPIKSADAHDETEAQHLFLGVALVLLRHKIRKPLNSHRYF